MWKEKGQEFVYVLINPVINGFIRVGITPNVITSIGLLVNVLAAIVFVMGAEFGARNDHSYIGWGGAVVLFAGLFDMMDGRLARVSQTSSKFGALYDSVLDRYSEMIMFLGICYYLISHDYFLSSLFAFIALMGSIMVSYTRARAEGLGINCSVGLMQRPERVLLIGISAVLCGLLSPVIGSTFKIDVDFLPFPLFETISIFTFPVAVLAVLSNYTAIKRLLYSKKLLLEADK